MFESHSSFLGAVPHSFSLRFHTVGAASQDEAIEV